MLVWFFDVVPEANPNESERQPHTPLERNPHTSGAWRLFDAAVEPRLGLRSGRSGRMCEGGLGTERSLNGD